MFPFPDSSAKDRAGCATNRGMIADSLAGQTVPLSNSAARRHFDFLHENGTGPWSGDHFPNAFSTSER
jgi:hypothetical protein